VLRKVATYYKKKFENIKNEFLVMIWNFYHFYKQNTKFPRNQDTFWEFIFTQKWKKKKKNFMYLKNYKNLLKKNIKKIF